MKTRRWSSEEVEIIRECAAAGWSVRATAVRIGRSDRSLHSFAAKRGVRFVDFGDDGDDDEYSSGAKADCHRHLDDMAKHHTPGCGEISNPPEGRLVTYSRPDLTFSPTGSPAQMCADFAGGQGGRTYV